MTLCRRRAKSEPYEALANREHNRTEPLSFSRECPGASRSRSRDAGEPGPGELSVVVDNGGRGLWRRRRHRGPLALPTGRTAHLITVAGRCRSPKNISLRCSSSRY